jgi:hypothetical protein
VLKRTPLIWFSHCLLILSVPLLAYGLENVKGIVQGTWTREVSPYVVDSTIVINANATLTIESGVSVVFTGPDSMKVYGTLQIQGIEGDSVFFYGQSSGEWRGLWFFLTSHSCNLSHVSIKNARWGIGIKNVPPLNALTINNCLISAYYIGIESIFSTFRIDTSTIVLWPDSAVATGNQHLVNAVHLVSSYASPIINYCDIYVTTSSTTVDPIGISIEYCDPEIKYCRIFIDSQGSSYGIWSTQSRESSFWHNLIRVSAKDYAFGSYMDNCSYNFINNTVVIQSESARGKCLSMKGSSSPTIINNILYGDGYSYGVSASDPIVANPVIMYNDIFNQFQNTLGCTTGVGCITTDPKFVDFANNDFTLSGTSPCIDAGSPPPGFQLDPDGSRSDIGWYTYEHAVPVLPDIPAPPLPVAQVLLEAYPNPFNASGRIQLSLPAAVSGELAIYNLEGQVVKIIYAGLGCRRAPFWDLLAGHGVQFRPESAENLPAKIALGKKATFYRLRPVFLCKIFTFHNFHRISLA